MTLLALRDNEKTSERALKARSAHVDFGAEAKASGQPVRGQIEHDPLSGAEHAQDAALEGIVVKFDFTKIRVGHDDTAARARVECFDDALHGATW